jgi:endonuclease-3
MTEKQRAIEILEIMISYLKKVGDASLLGEISEKAHEKKKDPDPFRILISTVLSVRNKDESTAIATKKLFDENHFNTPEKIAKADIEEIEPLIKRSGMYKTKSKRIKEISQILLDKYEGKVPKEMDKLIALPGVGRKVANCVRVYAYNIPCIPVDVHVHRISNRMGLIKTKKPDESEFALMELYPKKYWTSVNDTFVVFGKTVCRPISPKCSLCPVNHLCPKLIQVSRKKTKTKKSKGSKG